MLEHMESILGILRNSNVALRWLLLHSWGAQKKLRAAVAGASPPADDLLTLLLQIEQLEAEVLWLPLSLAIPLTLYLSFQRDRIFTDLPFINSRKLMSYRMLLGKSFCLSAESFCLRL